MMRIALLLGIALAAVPAAAKDRVAGPVAAEVMRVVDGDTVAVRARPWLGMTIETVVRLRGVDTPEKGGRAKCDGERVLGDRATDFVRRRLPAGTPVFLTAIEEDKYGGRVVASIAVGDEDLAAGLVGAGLARPYDGGRKSSWCD